jgi:hypothetical protein
MCAIKIGTKTDIHQTEPIPLMCGTKTIMETILL